MNTIRRPGPIALLTAFALLATLGGCAYEDDSLAPGLPPDQVRPSPAPATPLVIEESDIVKLKGDRLYVQNPQRGLAVVDVADPHHPRLLGQGGAQGQAGELYVRDHTALVLLDTPSASCLGLRVPDAAWNPASELALVDVSNPHAPTQVAGYCLPGKVIASRLIGHFLYVITSDADAGQSVVFSIDIACPTSARIVQTLTLPGDGHEIHMTDALLFVATKAGADCSTGWCHYEAGTKVHLVSLSAETGTLRRRGAVVLPGEPQGRFHMSAKGQTFRIVTYNSQARHSLLSIIDLEDLDAPMISGQVAIGCGEKLYATRFVGDRAYVVTYRRQDPLWVIDLKDPRHPRLLGELHVPGWSDFLFPRGTDRLLAVGRGNNGRGVSVSLFDVSDPTAPRRLQELTLGTTSSWQSGGDTFSEANLDHRAVTIIEDNTCSKPPLLVVPYSSLRDPYGSSCERVNLVQLIDVERDHLRRRGAITQRGAVRRSLGVHGQLLTLSDYELLSSDVCDRDRPRVEASLILGDASSLDGDGNGPQCYTDDPEWTDSCMGERGCGGFYMCALAPAGHSVAPPLSLLLLGALFALRAARRRRHRA